MSHDPSIQSSSRRAENETRLIMEVASLRSATRTLVEASKKMASDWIENPLVRAVYLEIVKNAEAALVVLIVPSALLFW